MALPEHSKIINKVARQILKPNGLERKDNQGLGLMTMDGIRLLLNFNLLKTDKELVLILV
jgi:hypothetical protein